jgi:hypothetical protein
MNLGKQVLKHCPDHVVRNLDVHDELRNQLGLGFAQENVERCLDCTVSTKIQKQGSQVSSQHEKKRTLRRVEDFTADAESPRVHAENQVGELQIRWRQVQTS